MGNKTPLYQSHLDAGARIVDFAGWDMPINYGSQIAEHEAVRTDAGMFDVSHMTVVDVSGGDAKAYLQHLLANDVARLQMPGKALYSCMLNQTGGVIDDLIAYFLHDNFYRVVINSATREKDLAWLDQQAGAYADLGIRFRGDVAMLAVQGPSARERAIDLFADYQQKSMQQLIRFQGAEFDDCFVARTGYTGEDGFEIMTLAEQMPDLWQRLLQAGVKPCGLGARDTLRLEAGMNLYGADMDETTSPLVSGLGWTVAMSDERDFIGKQALLDQQSAGIKQSFVGLVLLDKGVLRNHLRVVTPQGDGEITSGSYSPTLQKSIAMARIPAGASGEVEVEVRNKLLKAKIVKLPFVREGKSMLNNGGNNK
ncbi:MAG: glycine cleavage system aminomethyltransferase GcvT [Gammaproteobacteria bacterium]|nr:MAG: glycine cleavage system aminomethyltransferase GcvT [Gammaproteobacteria bacterium]UCH40194.1 MAG: glycine cleavage system aminomethyltransferase GcvT [Gammaproteobacteria bacterium]